MFIGLVLLAMLLLQFSKGVTFFRPTYDILLNATSAGGLKPSAQVLMSGVQVGTVAEMQLAPDGKSVTIALKIYRQFQIHKDARFILEQSGFLGDQYVAILPTRNEGAIFSNGEQAKAEAPLDLLEGVQAGKGLAGKLLENEEIASNVSQIVYNLSVTTSNLNRVGLWGILWQHRPPRTNEPAPPHGSLTPPKNPFE